MIRFACPTCSAIYNVTDDKAGATTKCAKCKNAMQIPDLPASPPAPPVARAVPPKPKKVEVEEDEPVRRRPVLDDDDDRPRRSRRRGEEDEDDRPRRSRRDDYDEDDRPRRGRREDYDDDDDYRPKKKKGGFNPLVLTVGILLIPLAILIAVFSILNMDEFKNPASKAYSAMDKEKETKALENLPAEYKEKIKKAKGLVSQTYWLMLIFEISFYVSLLAAIVWLVAGIGLILQQRFGRIIAFIATGLSGFVLLLLLVHVIMILSLDIPKETRDSQYYEGAFSEMAKYTGNLVVRILAHVLPIAVALSTLFLRPMQKLRNSF